MQSGKSEAISGSKSQNGVEKHSKTGLPWVDVLSWQREHQQAVGENKSASNSADSLHVLQFPVLPLRRNSRRRELQAINVQTRTHSLQKDKKKQICKRKNVDFGPSSPHDDDEDWESCSSAAEQ